MAAASLLGRTPGLGGTAASVGGAARASSSRTRSVRVCAYRDSGPLREMKAARLRHILTTYTKAHRFFPKVRFMLRHNSRLGEVWKLSGSGAELGNWVPEVSPVLHWRGGGIWEAEVALPPGTYSFKCMLRRADGSYVWESGENRHLVVPVKDRAGQMLLTYHMDVRTEPVEALALQPGKYGAMRPGEHLDVAELPEGKEGKDGKEGSRWQREMAGAVAGGRW